MEREDARHGSGKAVAVVTEAYAPLNGTEAVCLAHGIGEKQFGVCRKSSDKMCAGASEPTEREATKDPSIDEYSRRMRKKYIRRQI